MATLSALVLGLGCAHADKRVALVIGNSHYQKAPVLPNPERDAAAMGDLFRRVGFDRVDVKTDLDQAGLRRALREFSEIATDADIAVVYYAGHGIEMDGSNYLIPTDAILKRDIDVVDETVSLERVGEILEPARRLRLILLDACRDNPFASGIRRTSARRSIGQGLGKVEIAAGDTLIAFAAKPGWTAEDGEGANSPYTTALLHSLATPGLEIRMAMGRVRDEVLAATARRQEPTIFGSLGGAEIMLVPGKAGAAAAATQPDVVWDAAERAWAAAKDTKNVAVLEDFVRRYGDSFYTTLARARIDELKKVQVATVMAPGSPAITPVAPAKPPPAAVQAALTPPVPPVVAASPCTGGAMTASHSSGVPCPLSETAERALKPKDVFRECDSGCPEMVVVPPGSFTMGSPADEEGRFGSEGPQHLVTMARRFAVGRFAVTFEEWDACVADRGCGGYRPPDEGFGRGRRPAINVSWEDAKRYAQWLSKKTGKEYRLLTEAEWEYSARAGTATPFWWGSEVSSNQANYKGTLTYNGGVKGRFWNKTLPVDSFAANPFGLHQGTGNVSEWTEDCWNGSYGGAPQDGSAWMSGDCSVEVRRGGSWDDDPRDVRSAHRDRTTTTIRFYVTGFRVARTLTR